MPADLTPFLLAASVLLVVAGALAAWASANVAKRVAGVVIALMGATCALAVLTAPSGVMAAAVASAFGYCAVGVAVLARLQEAYGSVEAPEIDRIDQQDEPGPRA